MNWKCLFGFHDWKYKKLDERICKRCLKEQVGETNYASGYSGSEYFWFNKK